MKKQKAKNKKQIQRKKKMETNKQTNKQTKKKKKKKKKKNETQDLIFSFHNEMLGAPNIEPRALSWAKKKKERRDWGPQKGKEIELIKLFLIFLATIPRG